MLRRHSRKQGKRHCCDLHTQIWKCRSTGPLNMVVWWVLTYRSSLGCGMAAFILKADPLPLPLGQKSHSKNAKVTGSPNVRNSPLTATCSGLCTSYSPAFNCITTYSFSRGPVPSCTITVLPFTVFILHTASGFAFSIYCLTPPLHTRVTLMRFCSSSSTAPSFLKH